MKLKPLLGSYDGMVIYKYKTTEEAKIDCMKDFPSSGTISIREKQLTHEEFKNVCSYWKKHPEIKHFWEAEKKSKEESWTQN